MEPAKSSSSEISPAMAEELEKQLFQSALIGNSLQLEALLREDPLLLDRLSLSSPTETPIHVAALRGHADFVRSALNHNRRLATEPDSRGFTPLHVAAAAGSKDVVSEILRRFAGDDVVSVCTARSKDGRIPVHLAVEKGRLEVLSELARACPEPTRMRLPRGETLLHLCVRFDFLEGMKLISEIDRGDKLLGEKDDDGNTVLHLAALYKQLEAVKYLMTKPGMDSNAHNNNGFTALDLIYNSPRDLESLQLLTFLLESGTKRSMNIYSHHTTTNSTHHPKSHAPPMAWKRFFTYTPAYTAQLDQLRGPLIIAAALLAGPTFQIGVNPPPGNSDLTSLWTDTTVSLTAAVSVMVLLVGGIPLRNNAPCAWIIVSLFIVAVFFMFYACMDSILSDESRGGGGIQVGFYLFFGFLVLVCGIGLVHVVRLSVWGWMKLAKCCRRRGKRWRQDGRDASAIA